MKHLNILKSSLLKTVIVLVVSLLSFNANSQNPNWEVNENDFEFTMTFVASLNIDGAELSSVNDQLAAFSGGELRGVTNLVYVSSEDRYFAYLTAFSNANGDTLDFKIYDSVNDVVRDVSLTIDFVINAHQGNLFQSISFADPELSATADIEAFSFDAVTTIESSINSVTKQVDISIDLDEDITSLIPVYALSNGAQLFQNTTLQTSGTQAYDFSNPVVFNVRSQDNAVVNDWTINVNRISSDIQYYKKDEVCYERGAIKVITTQSFVVPAEVYLNNQFITSANFVNGEVNFSNLQANTYEVRIGSIVKTIIISLRSE